jgi:hypothetical protein
MRRALAASVLVAGLALTGCAEAEDEDSEDGTSIVDEEGGDEEDSEEGDEEEESEDG